jgi:hypothetical protein
MTGPLKGEANGTESVSIPPPPQALKPMAKATIAMTAQMRAFMYVFMSKLLVWCPFGRIVNDLKGAFKLTLAFAKAKKRPVLTYLIILLFCDFVKLKSAYFSIKFGGN